MKIAGTLLLFAGLAVLAGPARGAGPEPGQQLARQWCANCHVLPGQSRGIVAQGPPSFCDLASGRTPDQLRSFLMQPHGAMPPLSLSRTEIDALIAYIESCR
jgi:mono/diheme cytochrome c family protein